jgi:hypothetical protein
VDFHPLFSGLVSFSTHGSDQTRLYRPSNNHQQLPRGKLRQQGASQLATEELAPADYCIVEESHEDT